MSCDQYPPIIGESHQANISVQGPETTPNIDNLYNPQSDVPQLNSPYPAQNPPGAPDSVRPTEAEQNPAMVSLQQLMDEGGVPGFVVPTPQLHIHHDAEPKNIASATRSYVRDAKKYLKLVKGGDRDEVKCLFIGATLSSVAREWYDHWTTVQEHFTFEELINALLAHFAPGNQSQVAAMYRELHAGTYRMQTNESVEDYRLRFEAVTAPMIGFSEGDYIYWFQRGLSLQLAQITWSTRKRKGVLQNTAESCGAASESKRSRTQN
ncbi:hypothetical protein VaNZ11_009676 [Volvox africanus]|uniref:Retrotransposon gag domain-containing protein n=1 Tax=Volvox africanus TaxID=51714 RepID=A0ABQ5S7T7_9CHLO|nr:hypothetical protein VaNZ11_009676 [Volvox africanus]